MTQSTLDRFEAKDTSGGSEDAEVLPDGGQHPLVASLSRDVLYLRHPESGKSAFFLGEENWETVYGQTGGSADQNPWEDFTRPEAIELVRDLIANGFEVIDARGWSEFEA